MVEAAAGEPATGRGGRRRRADDVLRAILSNLRLARLEGAYLAFTLGEYATWVAILVYAYGRGGATEAGVVAVLQLLPGILIAPGAAVLGDRSSRDRVLAGSYVLQAAAMGATAICLSLGSPAPVVYLFAIVTSSSMALTRPAHGSLVPSVTRTPDELTAANVASGVIENASVLAGPALAGLLLGAAGPAAVFAASGLGLATAVGLVAGLRADEDRVDHRQSVGRTARVEVLAGLRALTASPGTRVVIGALGTAWLLWGALDILLVMLALDVLHIGQEGAGFLAAAIGAGGLAGSVIAVRLVGRRRLAPPLLLGLAVWGAPLAIIGLVPSPVTAFLLIAVGGAGRAVLDVAGRTLLQRVASDEVLTRVLGILEGIEIAALALGSIAAPLLVAALGAHGALVAVGLLMPLVALALKGRLAVVDAAEPVAAGEIAILRAVPMFAPLSAPTIERLARSLIRITAPAGRTLIREGDAGERFFIVVAGVATVTVAGQRIRDETAGDCFGEIALLRDVPRTATVTARTDLDLRALDRAPFLAALAVHGRSRAAAEAVVTERLAAG